MATDNALIVYFSQSGTTARVAEAIAAGLREQNYGVDLWNLKDGRPPNPQDYRLFGIGSPIYYFHIPSNVAHYVEHLSNLDNTNVFTFIVHGTHRIDTANWVRHKLEYKGGREVGYFHCYGEGHILPLLREGYLFSPDHPSKAELDRAKIFGRTVAQHIAGKPYDCPPDEPKPAIIYRFERMLASRWLMEHVYSRMFKVDHSKCTACGQCMENCPTQNIQKDALGHPVWDRRCIACLYCEMNCPEEAIVSALSRPFPGAFIRHWFRYNARRWVREGELEYVRVHHHHGKTARSP